VRPSLASRPATGEGGKDHRALPGDPDALGRSRGAGAPGEQVLPGPGGRRSGGPRRHPGSLRAVLDLGHRSASLRDELARWTERAPRAILGCASAQRRSSAQSVAQLTVAKHTIVPITSRLSGPRSSGRRPGETGRTRVAARRLRRASTSLLLRPLRVQTDRCRAHRLVGPRHRRPDRQAGCGRSPRGIG